MHHPGIEPDIHDVGSLVVAAHVNAQQCCGIQIEPGIDALRSTRLATSAINSAVRGCNSPDTLSTNRGSGTPHVRCLDTHQSGRPAIMRLMRCSPQAGIQSTCEMASSARLAQARLLHADEPLRRGAKNHRRLMAPTVRIGMMVRLILQQSLIVVQHLDDVRVRIEHLFAGKQRRSGQESAVAAHRIVDFQL